MGQMVKAQVLEVDTDKRRLRLGMKQLVPTSLDEYIAEHKEGDVVTGPHDGCFRRARASGAGRRHPGHLPAEAAKPRSRRRSRRASADLSSLTSMLQAKWKGGAGGSTRREPARAGQIRSFRIVKLDPAAKKIELELA